MLKHLERLISDYLQHCDIECGFAKETLKGKRQVLNHLLRYLNGKVFNVNQQCLNNYVRRGCNKLGISKDFTVHTMRHSFCTGMLNQGIDISVISRLMGHSSIKVTSDIYANYSIEDKKRAINMNPQIRNSLSVKEVFLNFEKDIENKGYSKDVRFNLIKKITSDSINVTLTTSSK